MWTAPDEINAGTDTIKDFKDGEDLLGLGSSISFGDLTITDSSGDVIITDNNNGNVLATIDNISSSDLTVNDFTAI